jgi:hypothetical protein
VNGVVPETGATQLRVTVVVLTADEVRPVGALGVVAAGAAVVALTAGLEVVLETELLATTWN